MNRSRQLILESALIAALLLGITLAGTVSTESLPVAWVSVQNPDLAQPQYNLTDLALFYNSTLAELASQRYSAVENSLNQSSLLNYPPSISATVADATSELAETNASIPPAVTLLNTSSLLIEKGEVQNASSTLNQACAEADDANSSFSSFTGRTTMDLANLGGVPTAMYLNTERLVGKTISGLLGNCQELSNRLSLLENQSGSAGARLSTILLLSSPQKSIVTGGYVFLEGSLSISGSASSSSSSSSSNNNKNDANTSNSNSNNSSGGSERRSPSSLEANQLINFYINGTEFNSTRTNASGGFVLNSSTPFAYEPTVSIWAVFGGNQTIGIPECISNTLNFVLVFNETEIVLGDPPAFLPTSNFTVEGNLSTTRGIPLPNAPVRITSFGADYFVSTDREGLFKEKLTVPANASDGTHYIYAAFASQGVFGPSVNFTSIVVFHEKLDIAIDPLGSLPALSGFGKTISGTVKANGAGVEDASVILSTPWGVVDTRTDGSGRFNVTKTIPLGEFRESGIVSVSVTPPEPYIAAGGQSAKIGILNPIEIAAPLLVGGVLAYEVKSLGLLALARRAGGRKKEVEDDLPELLEPSKSSMMLSQFSNVGNKVSHQIVEVYMRALALASRRFPLRLKASMTIREIYAEVKRAAGREGDGGAAGLREFMQISLALEDFLYSRDSAQVNYDDDTTRGGTVAASLSRILEHLDRLGDQLSILRAQEELSRLEKIWSEEEEYASA